MALSENDERRAQGIAMDASVQLMLRYLFEMQFALSDDPHKMRDEARKQLLELTDQVGLPPLNPEIMARTRENMKAVIGELLTNLPAVSSP